MAAEQAVRSADARKARAQRSLRRASAARRACTSTTCEARAVRRQKRARAALAQARSAAATARARRRSLVLQDRADREAAAASNERRRVAALRADSTAWKSLFPGQDLYWDGCATIGYRINTSGAPSWAAAQVREVLDEVSRRSGHTFAYRGTTTVVPDTGSVYPGDTDLVLAWVKPGQSSLLGKDQAASAVAVGGILSSQQVGVKADGTARRRADDGLVLMNREFSYQRGMAAAAPHYQTPAGQVLLHEMGHVLGLDHVDNEQQLMNPVLLDGRPGLGAGDVAGMKAMGSQQLCVNRAGR
ncbi:matrixin family metalloprotease [Solicola sp. PLA-1-18]|uniref:matrixin family metalloprotease n=1 Tax=Solicola sp. PLA-1-18 TaxID=3380532 RepID=UPI003B77489C